MSLFHHLLDKALHLSGINFISYEMMITLLPPSWVFQNLRIDVSSLRVDILSYLSLFAQHPTRALTQLHAHKYLMIE